MSKVIARFSATVTYNDGSTDTCSSHLDDKENIAFNNLPINEECFGDIEDLGVVTQMLAALQATIALGTLSTSGKTVTHIVAEFSGRAAFDDNTSIDFLVQFDSDSGIFVPNYISEDSLIRAIGCDAGCLTKLFNAFIGGDITSACAEVASILAEESSSSLSSGSSSSMSSSSGSSSSSSSSSSSLSESSSSS